MRIGLKGILFAKLAFLILAADLNTTFSSTLKSKLDWENHYGDNPTQIPEKEVLVSAPEYEEDEYTMAKDPKLMLKEFSEKLRRFISKDGFDYVDFEAHVEGFRNEISDIEFYTETELNDSTIKIQIAFARRMFSLMVESADKLKRYSRYNIPAYDLVYEILELHIRVLGLIDYRGLVDTESKDFVLEILDIYLNLYIWEKDFKKIANVPAGMRELFEHTTEQIKEIFEIWRHQLGNLI